MLHQGRYQEIDGLQGREREPFGLASAGSVAASAIDSTCIAEAALRLNAIINRGFVRPYIDEKTRNEFATAVKLGLQGR